MEAKNKKKTPGGSTQLGRAVEAAIAPNATQLNIRVVEELPTPDAALVDTIYIVKERNEMWIKYSGTTIFTLITPTDIYDNATAALEASTQNPNKICFF